MVRGKDHQALVLLAHFLNEGVHTRRHALPRPPLPPPQQRQHVRPDVFPLAHQPRLIHQVIQAVQLPRLVPNPRRRGAEAVADVIREVRFHQVEEQKGARPVALVVPQDRPRTVENGLHGRLQPYLGGLQVLAEAAQQQVLGDQLAAQARLADQRQQAEEALVARRYHVPDAVDGLETPAEAENVGGHHVGRHHVGAVAEGAQAFGQAGRVRVNVARLPGGAVLVRHQAGKHRGGGGQRPAAAGARLVEANRPRRRVRQAMVAPGVHRVPPQAVRHHQHDVLRRVHARSPLIPSPLEGEG